MPRAYEGITWRRAPPALLRRSPSYGDPLRRRTGRRRRARSVLPGDEPEDRETSSTGRGRTCRPPSTPPRSGARLRVRGVCVGTFSIARNLKLVGHATAAYPTPTLDCNAPHCPDGERGLWCCWRTDHHTWTSIDSGGGIHNAGILTLRGSASVSGNTATGGTDVGRRRYLQRGTLTLMGLHLGEREHHRDHLQHGRRHL